MKKGVTKKFGAVLAVNNLNLTIKDQELLAVTIIIVSMIVAFGRYLFRRVIRRTEEDHYHQLKVRLGKALLLGLEVLVAADIVRTVALEATLETSDTTGSDSGNLRYYPRAG
jgi:uncharacterized membrane protein